MSDLERFEGALRAHGPLQFPRGPDVEWRALPPMVQVYRDMLLPSGAPPKQETFATRVVMDAERLDPGAVPRDGVFARACRTYPSLVRQHHLCLALQASAVFESVQWIPWLDYQGIDLLCLHEPFAIGVALSVDTERARFWRTIKAGRKGNTEGLSMVELNVSLGEHRIGDFDVHPQSHVQIVTDRLHDVMFSCRTMAIPTVVQARAIFTSALAAGAFSGKPGWSANGVGFYWALVQYMRRRADGLEDFPQMEELAYGMD